MSRIVSPTSRPTDWISPTRALSSPRNPPNSEEAQIVTDLKSLLAEIDVGGLHYDRNHSLAAMLAQVWASFLDDVCVASLFVCVIWSSVY